MSEDGSNEVSLDAEDFLSPLKMVALEAHEVYLELKDAGFPEKMMQGIIAHMLSDAILYHAEFEIVETEDDEDFYDDDDDEEGNLKE